MTDHRRRRLLIFVVLLCPFYLNDFSSIYVLDWRWWLTIDYLAVKLLPLVVIVWLLRSRRMSPAEFGLARQSLPSFLATALGLALVGILIDQNAYRLIADWPGYAALGSMPPIQIRLVDQIDLSLGLLLVGAVEELVFRAYLCSVLTRFTDSALVIVAVSALAFGLIHWSGGLHTVFITATIGALFMGVYLRTRRVAPIILAHFLVNVIDFADLVPKSVFQFA